MRMELDIEGDDLPKLPAGSLVQEDFGADYAPMHKHPLDFSNAENPWGHSPKVGQAIIGLLSGLSRYPDRGHRKLIDALAAHHRLPVESLFIGNGAAGCIQNVVASLILGGRQVALPALSFPLPIFMATLMGGVGVKVPMRADFGIDFDALRRHVADRTALVFLCNPNNPTGLCETPQAILDFARSVAVPVLVSEANIEYGGISLLGRFSEWPRNLIVVRSFSKAYGLAGLRIGFGIAAAAMVARITKMQPPFAVSRLSEAAAITALEDQAHVADGVAAMRVEREWLSGQLKTAGFSVLPSQANTLVAGLPDRIKSPTRFLAALEKHGVTVLAGSSFDSAIRRCIRISPRQRKQNKAFIGVIRQVLQDMA